MTTTINIVAERQRRSMSQKRLAHEAGIDARTLRKIEKGETVSPESLRNVLLALGLVSAGTSPHTLPVAPSDGERPAFTNDLPFSWLMLLAAILAIFGVVTLIFVAINEVSPNATLQVTSQTSCSDRSPARIAGEMSEKISLGRARISDVRHGTTSCSFKLTGYIERSAESRDIAISKLKTLGYDAEVYVAGRIFPLW